MATVAGGFKYISNFVDPIKTVWFFDFGDFISVQFQK